ncbi:hypothetical protein ScPMuIL_004167, partial [Solemya velum]
DVMDRPVWYHYMTVIIPDNVTHKDSAFMFIDGGENNKPPPDVTDNFVALTILASVSTGAVTCDLKMIPNEPITFKADPSQKSRDEDAIIAWTWKRFVDQKGSDPEILLRMPMTKGAVRALDTIAAVAKEKIGTNITKFVVAGASKRGWTTWTTAAVDKRVVGFIPIVMDLLHMVKNLHHHFRAYGGWTFAFKDYYDLNFTASLDNPAIQAMADIIDPITYNYRYKGVPKLVISTTGDEFFLPDDSHYYFHDLTEPKYVRMVPNAEHSCAGHETSLLFTMRAFFLSVITKTPLPKLQWTRQQTPTGGMIKLTTDREPLTTEVYHARTIGGKRRDFRLLVASPDDPTKPFPHPVIWFKTSAESKGNNTFVAQFSKPTEGWLAFFIQVTFQGVGDAILEFTTETMIIPDTFPFPDCHGSNCTGSLV